MSCSAAAVPPVRTMPTAAPPLVMTFSATDPTGGAGLSADAMTLCALACHPLSVATAVTVQDCSHVHRVFPLGADWVTAQAKAVLKSAPVALFKVGMVATAEVAQAIAQLCDDYPHIPLLFDPVLASGAGDSLSAGDLLSVLRETLLPRAALITPNTREAMLLAGENMPSAPFAADQRQALEDKAVSVLLAAGCRQVLVTGTDMDMAAPQVVHHLYGKNRRRRWENRRLPGSYHGSGCTLASAIAAHWARRHGHNAPGVGGTIAAAGTRLCGTGGTVDAEFDAWANAVDLALAYTADSLAQAFAVGEGQWIARRLQRRWFDEGGTS